MKRSAVRKHVYRPNPKNQAVYAKLYTLYRRLHDSFGVTPNAGCLQDVMKEHIAIREA